MTTSTTRELSTSVDMAPQMTHLVHTANALFAADKGLLAIDESIPTCNARFAALGIAETEDNRRNYRELIISTPALHESISGVILCDETFRQLTADGRTFPRALMDNGITPGIKVDLGTHPMAGHPGEYVTEGLDGLRERLAFYVASGARFAKWRAVFTIGETTPSRACIAANAHTLARYAALCQEAGLVPVVEPEALMTGNHSAYRCGEVTDAVLHEVFSQLHTQGVAVEAMLLKTNMVLAGSGSPIQMRIEEVAEETICCLRRTVPAATAGIVFLSGGQSGDLATSRLHAISTANRPVLPWPVGFSYGRAIQQPALSIWNGHKDNWAAAQRAIRERAENNRDARRRRQTTTTIPAQA